MGNNIETNLRETGYEGICWIQLAWGRIQWWTSVNTIMNLWVP